MKFAICNEIFQGWLAEDAIAYAARVGYDAVEIAPFTLGKYVGDVSPERRAQVREAARRCGVAVSGIHWVLAQTEGLHLSHPDLEVRRRTASYLVDLVDFCSDLGGRYIVVGSPKQRSLLPGVTRNQAWAWTAENFRGAVRRAEEKQITICLEPLSPTETDFINTASEAIEFTAAFGSPAFKIILDVKAMCSESMPLPEIIRQSWPHFAYFHANDRNLKGPGFGEVDFRAIAVALREVGYTGFVSVEVFNFEEGPEEIASRSLSYLQRTFAA